MKVLFLDFDGVLNTEKYIRCCGGTGLMLDPSKLILLRQIIDETDAKIVLSTSWREYWYPDAARCCETGKQIHEIFESCGLTILDKTPILGGRRETEIYNWLVQHPEAENFAVLDDMRLDAEFMRGHFVKTSGYSRGLDKAALEETVEILRKGNAV